MRNRFPIGRYPRPHGSYRRVAAERDQPTAGSSSVRFYEAQVVRGDDGMDHVEYELLIVSVLPEPVTLTSVTVLDPAGAVPDADREGRAFRRDPAPLRTHGVGCDSSRPRLLPWRST